MKKLKVIQIGVTHEHAEGKMRTLLSCPGEFEVVGYVNDLNSAHTPYNVTSLLPLYGDLHPMTIQEALEYPDTDMVTIEVPNNELVETAEKFARKGVALHMDKPAGEDLEAYKRLLDICKEKTLPFQIAYMFRGNPAFRFCIRAIKEKLIGDVISIECDMNHCYGGEQYREYISKFKGGIMYNLGCHLIDFIVAAMGRPAAVHSFIRSVAGDVESSGNNSYALLEYPNAFAHIKVCGKVPGCTPARSMSVKGTKGTIFFSPMERFDGKGLELELLMQEDTPSYPAGKHTLVFNPVTDRYINQLREFAGIIRGERTESAYTVEHDLLVHEVVLAASGLKDFGGNLCMQ